MKYDIIYCTNMKEYGVEICKNGTGSSLAAHQTQELNRWIKHDTIGTRLDLITKDCHEMHSI